MGISENFKIFLPLYIFNKVKLEWYNQLTFSPVSGANIILVLYMYKYSDRKEHEYLINFRVLTSQATMTCMF